MKLNAYHWYSGDSIVLLTFLVTQSGSFRAFNEMITAWQLKIVLDRHILFVGRNLSDGICRTEPRNKSNKQSTHLSTS